MYSGPLLCDFNVAIKGFLGYTNKHNVRRRLADATQILPTAYICPAVNWLRLSIKTHTKSTWLKTCDDSSLSQVESVSIKFEK